MVDLVGLVDLLDLVGLYKLMRMEERVQVKSFKANKLKKMITIQEKSLPTDGCVKYVKKIPM